MNKKDINIHPTADVSSSAVIGSGTSIWNYAQVREGVTLGKNCILGKNSYIDLNVTIGDNVKIQNNALIYHGATLEDGVFIGPQACLTNDKYPRAITQEGRLKGGDDWDVGRIVVKYGASIGAGALILPDLTIGEFALVAAGAIVTRDVPDHGLVIGAPGRLVGYVCSCGKKLEILNNNNWICQTDGKVYKLKELQ